MRVVCFLVLGGMIPAAAQPLFTVYEQTVQANELGKTGDVPGVLLRVFFEEYAKKARLEITEDELAPLRRRFQAAVEKSRPERSVEYWIATLIKSGMSREQAEREAPRYVQQVEAAERRMDFPYLVGQNWKLNRHLWNKHGGRVALSAFGTHLAKDALLREVEALERVRSVVFHTAEARRQFFEFYSRYGGDGVVEGERARRAFAEVLGQ